MGKYDVESEEKSPSGDGCRCSTAVGFLLVLFAIAIAVGVGLIVHFAGNKSTDVTCNVNLTGITSSNANLAGCVALAQGNNPEICNACPARSTMRPSPTSATTTVAMTTTTDMATTPRLYPIRLPMTFKPISYTIWLRPDFYSNNQSEFMFHGKSSVLVTAQATSRDVIMHSRDLTFTDDSIIVRAENDVENMFDSYELYGPSELIIIRTTKDLMQGQNYVVEFTNFSAPIRQDFTGLFIGSWKENNETKYHVTSQMEPTFPRLVFPCFDEPAMKATFDVTLSRKSHVTSISNMPIASTITGTDDWIDEKFRTTPVMSTYLLIFFIGDFTGSSVTVNNRYEITSWSRRDQEANRAYSLEVTPKLMDYFEDFFDIQYPLPKQDMIAMLSFPYGAMENWGAFVFRERYMLYDPVKSSDLDMFSVIAVISHECAHNWYGNIVSPAWWDDIWLNEAFASLMEYQGADVIVPEWKPFEMLMKNVLTSAMPYDEQVTSHPVFIEGLEENDEIFAAFDVISYIKGGHLLYMVSRLLGPETFSKGLNRYISAHSYGNARHQDLWVALQAEADKAGSDIPNIPAMMSTWIYQMGFPTVHVEFKEEGKLRLTQERFLKDKSAVDIGRYISRYGYKWDIPFTYATSKNIDFDLPGDVVLMNHTDNSVFVQSDKVPAPTGDAWVLGNIQGLVFMQVNYDQRNWNALTNQLRDNHTVIPTLNRMQLVHDAWNLAKTGDVTIDTAMGLISYLGNEREYGPWNMAIIELTYISKMLHNAPFWGLFYDFMQSVLRPSYLDVSAMQANGLSQKLVQSLIMEHACGYGISECIANATDTFMEWMSDPENKPAAITADLFTHYTCNGVRYGGEDEWDFMLQVYQTTSSQAEKEATLQALACTKHDWLISRYLAVLAHGDVVVTEDYPKALDAIAMYGNNLMLWDWFRMVYDFITERVSAYFLTQNMAKMVSNFRSQLRLHEFEKFVQEKGIEDHPTIVAAIANVKGNIQWVEANVPLLEKWLENNTRKN